MPGRDHYVSPHSCVWCGEVQSTNVSLAPKLHQLVCAIAVWVLILGAVPARSQMGPQPVELYEGQKVSAVEIAGRPGYDRSWERLIVQRAGQPFAQAAVQASVDALKKLQGVTGVNLQI